MGAIIGNLFRALPPFRGKLRLGKLSTSLFLRPSEERIVRLRHGIFLKLPNLIENLSLELFVNGYYEKELVDFLIKNLPPNGQFIDVGANIGAISVFVAKARPDVSIYAFEASALIVQYLQENISINKLSNIQVIHKAVHTDDEKDMDFYSPLDKFGKGSLAPVFTNKKELVRTVRLDRFCKDNLVSPDYIKIDVEGFEYFVIDSLDSILREQRKPVIIFEFVDWAERESTAKYVGAAQSRLLDAGYKIYNFDDFIHGTTQHMESIALTGSLELIGIPI